MGIYDAMMLCRADVQVSGCVWDRKSGVHSWSWTVSLSGRRWLCTARGACPGAACAPCTVQQLWPTLRHAASAPTLHSYPLRRPSPSLQTYCFGLAASMGAFLLGAGAKGKRYSMPNSRIMIHQPLGGASGQAVDIEIQARAGDLPALPQFGVTGAESGWASGRSPGCRRWEAWENVQGGAAAMKGSAARVLLAVCDECGKAGAVCARFGSLLAPRVTRGLAPASSPFHPRLTLGSPSAHSQAREIMYHKANINRIMSEYTGQPVRHCCSAVREGRLRSRTQRSCHAPTLSHLSALACSPSHP